MLVYCLFVVGTLYLLVDCLVKHAIPTQKNVVAHFKKVQVRTHRYLRFILKIKSNTHFKEFKSYLSDYHKTCEDILSTVKIMMLIIHIYWVPPDIPERRAFSSLYWQEIDAYGTIIYIAV